MCARFKLLGMCVFFVCGFVLCIVFFECDCIQIFCVCVFVGRACVCVLMCLYFCPVLRFFILRFFTMIQLYLCAVLLLLAALFFLARRCRRVARTFLRFVRLQDAVGQKKPWRLNKSWWLADDTDWHPISCHFWSCSTFNEDTIHPTTMSDDFKELISQHEVFIKDDDDAIDNVHAVTVPDAVAAGIPTHADDMAIPTPGACRPNTRIAAGNIISVDSTTSLPTPSSPPVRATLPRVVAPTTVSAPLQADIQALVATLTQHVTELLLQQAVSSDQVAPILAEKKGSKRMQMSSNNGSTLSPRVLLGWILKNNK